MGECVLYGVGFVFEVDLKAVVRASESHMQNRNLGWKSSLGSTLICPDTERGTKP